MDARYFFNQAQRLVFILFFIYAFSVVLVKPSFAQSDWDYKKSDVKTENDASNIKNDASESENTNQNTLTQSAYSDVKTDGEIKPDFVTVPVPSQNIRVGTVITPNDITYIDIKPNQTTPETVTDSAQIIGQQARKPLYMNKPMMIDSLGAIITVKRNQDVAIIFEKFGVVITTAGRALDQGGQGDRIKAMNLESKKIVTGKITKDGDIDVTI
jgi:flagellar basal body P-ring formation protein FlgA